MVATSLLRRSRHSKDAKLETSILKRGAPTPIPRRRAQLSKVFSAFFCPVTHDLMKDPVMTDDGQTYERAVSKRDRLIDRLPIVGLSHRSRFNLFGTSARYQREIDRLIDRVQTQYTHGGHRLLSVFTVLSARQMYFALIIRHDMHHVFSCCGCMPPAYAPHFVPRQYIGGYTQTDTTRAHPQAHGKTSQKCNLKRNLHCNNQYQRPTPNVLCSLRNKELRPNVQLRQAIEEWRESNGQPLMHNSTGCAASSLFHPERDSRPRASTLRRRVLEFTTDMAKSAKQLAIMLVFAYVFVCVERERENAEQARRKARELSANTLKCVCVCVCVCVCMHRERERARVSQEKERAGAEADQERERERAEQARKRANSRYMYIDVFLFGERVLDRYSNTCKCVFVCVCIMLAPFS
jgi:hypothetical protein